MDVKATIREYEHRASALEPDAAERASLQQKCLGYAEDFLNSIGSLPAYVLNDQGHAGLASSPVGEDGSTVDTILSLLHDHVDVPGLNPASGGHLGYIPGGGIYPSALADYLAAVTNRYAGIFYAGPGAVAMENMLLRWMAGLAGYPADAGGNLTSGGSIANLIGIAAARDAMEVRPKDIERSVIYLTAQAHHSVDKAIRIAGLRECVIRAVPMDRGYRMDAGQLERMVVGDRDSGLRPWLVIAAAGTTDVGAVDPLGAIADIARTHRLWFHLDGAYGAFFVLCDEGKKALSGMERSDSLVMDPHKGLFLPYGSGAVLVRKSPDLYASFRYQAAYLQDARIDAAERSPADLSPELTKHFRGLRLWLPLKLFGVAPFRAALTEKLLLARYAFERLREMKGFEVGGYPDLSVVTFRYVPRQGDADEFNRRLLKEIQADGRVFLSSTTLDGVFILRIAILCFRTHLDTVDLALDLLKTKAEELENR